MLFWRQNFAQFNSIEILNESKVIIIFELQNICFMLICLKIIQSASRCCQRENELSIFVVVHKQTLN